MENAETNTDRQVAQVIAGCKALFSKKLKDYSAAWRIMRPESITDQIFIKAKRIRTLETIGNAKIDEGILPEFIGIVNYGIIGLIQLDMGYVDEVDITNDQAESLYDTFAEMTTKLLSAKNHDYGEAWRSMRVHSYTDLILSKLMRTKQIESNNGATVVSEGIAANYMDMVNYAIFGIIKLTE